MEIQNYAGYLLAAHVSPPDMAELRERTKKEIGGYLQAKVEELTAERDIENNIRCRGRERTGRNH